MLPRRLTEANGAGGHRQGLAASCSLGRTARDLLGQYATVYTRSWAVDSMNGRVRLKSEMMPQVHVATATTAGKCVSGAGKSACMRRTEVISCLCCCRCGSPGSFYPAAVARCTATGIKRCICNQTWVRGYGFVAKPVGPPEPLPALRAYTSFWSWLRNVEWSMSFLFHQTTSFGTLRGLYVAKCCNTVGRSFLMRHNPHCSQTDIDHDRRH